MNIKQYALPLTGALFLPMSSLTYASETSEMEEVEVNGHRANLIGEAISASVGEVSQEDIEIRPILRTGEILETIPGMVATQHSGSGKANQYFLRGFNLDHGTDFATSVDKMPVNFRTHAHGQGYTDINFIIPELIQNLTYKKGSYYADVGDFSGVGAANIHMATSLEQSQLQVGLGEDNFYRGLLAGSTSTGVGELVYGLEYQRYSGPWSDIDENVRKKNAFLRHTWGDDQDNLSITFMGYDNGWNAPDQIPQRAVDEGIITDRGSLDRDVGGETYRYSLSSAWNKSFDDDHLNLSVYAIRYKLDLWSNFTYYLENPCPNGTPEPGNGNRCGDEFAQRDRRDIYGWDLSYVMQDEWAGFDVVNTFGSQARYDNIGEVGLYNTVRRHDVDVVRSDKVHEWNTAVYWQNQWQWTDKLRTVLGLRYDYFHFDVDAQSARDPSTLAANSGSKDDGIFVPKFNLVYTINDEWEYYASVGQGYHSNDARGVVQTLDPVTGDAVDSADPLVKTFGYETGVRAFLAEQLNMSLVLWSLDVDSELIFVGDSGATEDTGTSSTRYGLEATAYYYLNDEWTLDLEYSYTEARYDHDLEFEPANGSAPVFSNKIPGAIPHVVAAGVNAQFDNGLFGNMRVRYFSEYPLDGGRKGSDATITNMRLGYQFKAPVRLTLDILNLFDSDSRDIEYYYASRINESEPSEGVDDVHFRVYEPRTFRFYAAYQF
ncbi:Uncharacterised protein [BD1-7 clade bacterium]|uniref:Vitamin B12 transporter BtuB n=1 Tax=BD1-7 clade bacterium TaxID=2029982 RepID=A0A5S9NSR9_9GAMM|nr:Uncharacterised protein [BD1-7 clade bacterium]CAA0093694.1 Uncharacterised protein [BD1-7 clade bacterium]